MPFPVPGLADVTPSHAELLVADHSQCAGAVTAKLPFAASLLKEALLGESSIVHAPRPSSRTDTDCPAIANVPIRVLSDELGVRLTLTTPLPVPFEPLVIAIHTLSEVEVHVQWLAVVTFTDPVPPDAPKVSDDVDSV